MALRETSLSRPMWAASLLTLLACLVALFVIDRVPYTEIDWRAYMQEVGGFLSGELDYVKLRGDTGPLVYPAVFVYIYSALFYATDEGTDVLLAQYLYAGLFVLFIAIVMIVYLRARPTPLTVLGWLVVSRRIYSIFVLRLFNDPVAMLLLYASIAATQARRAHLGAVLYSLGVGVKMNLFLFAPGFAALWYAAGGFRLFAQLVALCAAVQLLAGAPFLLSHPVSYLSKAFELSRVFTFKWSVNWQFVDEATFQSKTLAKVLLVATIGCWLVLLALWAVRVRAWRVAQRSVGTAIPASDPAVDEGDAVGVKKGHSGGGLRHRVGVGASGAAAVGGNGVASDPLRVGKHASAREGTAVSRLVYALGTTASEVSDWAAEIAAQQIGVAHSAAGGDGSAAYGGLDPFEVLAVSNFVGVAWCRSLHAQFYVWYFHTLPYLVAHCVPQCTPWVVRGALLLAIEGCWNVYPYTPTSSAVLQVSHAILLVLVMVESVTKSVRWARKYLSTPAGGMRAEVSGTTVTTSAAKRASVPR